MLDISLKTTDLQLDWNGKRIVGLEGQKSLKGSSLLSHLLFTHAQAISISSH
jgi:hypothetical protein